MNYDEFVDRVAQRAGVSREDAAKLTQATLQVLADRISGGQAADLEAVLQDGKLARPFRKAPQKPADKYGWEGFVDRVRNLAPDLPEESIPPGIRAVILTLRDAVPDKEFTDTMAQLPHEFRDLLAGRDPLQEAGGRTAGAASRGGQRAGGPEPHTVQSDAVVQRTAERSGLSPDAAAELTRATLETLGDRIGRANAHDLAQRLPEPSAEWLDESSDRPPQNYGPDDFVSRVRDIAPDVDDDDVTTGIQAVIIALRDAAGEDEVDIALQSLGDDYDELLVRIS